MITRSGMFSEVVSALRANFPPNLWQQGIALARNGGARVTSLTFTEWTFHVAPNHTVRCCFGLWTCSCAALFFRCVHIAAAAVTLEALGASWVDGPRPRRAGLNLRYRLRSESDALYLSVVQRYTTEDGCTHEHVLVGVPTSEIVAIAALPAGQAEALLHPGLDHSLGLCLALAGKVELDSAPVRFAAGAIGVKWLAYDTPEGVFPILLPPQVSGKIRVWYRRSQCVLIDDTLHFLRADGDPLLTVTDHLLEQVEESRPFWPFIRAALGGASLQPAPGAPPKLAPPPLAQQAPEAPGPAPPTKPQPPASPRTPPSPQPPAIPAPTPQPPPPPPANLTPSPQAPPPPPTPPAANTPPPPAVPPPPSPGPTPSPTRPAAPSSAPPPANPRPRLSPRWKANATDYDVTFGTTGEGGETIELPSAQVLPIWREGTPTIEIKRGVLADLPVDWLDRYGPILERLHAARDQAGKLQRWARPFAASLCLALKAVPPPELAGLAALVDGFAGVPAATLPPGLNVTLRDYQRRGVDWLCLLRDAELGALLADDMGLGKTVQTICALPERSRKRTLIVAPTSTLPNWVAEIKKFRPRLKVSLYRGPRRSLDPRARVIVTSYAVLRNDRDKLSKHEWDVVVLDEAQAIKEARTVTANAACALKARWRLALSGTPVENRLAELWSIAHFLNPGLLGAGKDFVANVSRPVEAGSAAQIAELQAKIRPFVLRRRKSEVARELPPRTDIVLTCQLDEHEREVYEALRLAARDDVTAHLKAGGAVIAALELLLRLRQAACHVGLVPGQTAERSSKLDLLLDHLVDITASGHRALVFSQWTSLLDRLEPALAAHRVEHIRLDGKTQNREAVVARFQAADGPPVMLLSLKAGGVGLNLTAADHVYLLDPWWNPAVEDQAADRTHRIGQNHPVFVHRLVAEDTVEERILALHHRKRALAVTAVDGSQSPNLTRDDLLELLR